MSNCRNKNLSEKSFRPSCDNSFCFVCCVRRRQWKACNKACRCRAVEDISVKWKIQREIAERLEKCWRSGSKPFPLSWEAPAPACITVHLNCLHNAVIPRSHRSHRELFIFASATPENAHYQLASIFREKTIFSGLVDVRGNVMNVECANCDIRWL